MDRLPTGVRITPAGRAFAARARTAVVAAEAAARRRPPRASGSRAGAWRSARRFARRRARCRRRYGPGRHDHPEMAVRLREFDYHRELVEAAASGAGDIALGPTPTPWSGPAFEVGWDELHVVLPATDPLTRSDGPVSLAGLADREWILLEPPHGIEVIAAEACRRAGFEPRELLRTAQLDGAARLAVAGLGPTLVPGNTVPQELADYVRRLDPAIVWPVSAYVRDAWARAAKELVETLADGPLAKYPPPGALVLDPNAPRSPD
ncbi:MAG: LysR family transcriptional regulator substrate-binding protein [Solirubrobacterales bacterium]